MKSKIFISLILVSLISVAWCQGNSSEHKKLQIPTNKVGDVINGVNYKVDQGRSFQLISIQNLEKKYLFLSLEADQIYEHIELSLTIFKEGAQTPLKRCVKQEVDSCYIPKGILEQNQTLLIVIESPGQECQYQLRSYWSNLQHLAVGSQTKFMFSKEEQKQIYHLELEGKQFNELRIIIKPDTRRYAFDRIKMYGTYGKDSLPSSNNYDFKSVYLWQDAQGIYLNRKQLKQLAINLILEGEIETVYTMTCDIVTKLHNDIQINNKVYEYLQKDQTYDYHIEFKNSEGKLQHDLYVLTIAIFTGDLGLEFYTNKDKTTRLTSKEPYMYMGDMQYILTKQEIQSQIPNGLYIKALSKNRVTTFMLEYEGRSKSRLFELHQHIYQFMQVKNTSVSYFKIARFQQGDQKAFISDLKVVLTLIQVLGKVSIQFRKCNTTKQECTGELYLAHSTKIQSEYRSVGSKETYSLALASDFWTNVNAVQKNAIIIVALSNLQQNKDSFAAVQYNIGNRPEFLRQNKPIQSHVLKNQIRIYKFVNTDNNIEKLKLHINKISGCFNTYVFRHEPTEAELVNDSNKISGSVYETTEKLTDEPLVIVIRGEDSATYSLVVQPVHKDEDEIDYITLSEDVEFKIKIAPNRYEIFEVVPILNSIFYNYKSSGAVQACVLKDNVCQEKEAKFTNEGQIKLAGFSERAMYIKLKNPSSTKSIEVSTIFHSNVQNHCELKKVGQLYKQVVKEGSCFITAIDSAQDFEVLIVREEVGQLTYTMALCDKLLNFAVKDDGEQRYIISADQIKSNCLGHAESNFLFAVNGKKQVNQAKPNNIHLKYLVEFTSSKVILPDGIGYHGSEITTEQPVKKFVYPLLNKIQTSIILQTQRKLYFLVKIIQASQRDKTKISINSFDLSSPSQKFFYLQSVFLKITDADLKKAKCQECELLIYVYSKEEVGTIVDFTIEVTQNFINLEQGVPKSGYLIQNSKAYYGFKIKSTGSLLVETSDNNHDCTELYLSSLEYPDEKKHLERSYDGQIIIDVLSADKNYYITVKARKNCAYTITAALTEGKNHVVKLERGVLGYCNLAQNQTKLYTFKHLSQNPFKVISLHKYGQVEFYLNRTTPEAILALMKQQSVNLESFTYQSDFKNRLILNKGQKELCKGCHYILAVHAKKHTQSSIFLGDEQTKIPLSQEKVLNDILPKENMVTRGQFYYFKEGVLQVKVHSGKLQVEIIYKDQSFKKVFEKNKELVSHNFTLAEEKGFYDSATAIFTALEDSTIYSARIKPIDMHQENSQGTHYINIDPNEPNYLYLSQEQLSCAKGYLKRADERIFVSFYTDDREAANQMKIVGKLNQNFTKISQDTTRNVISIAFIEAANQMLSSAVPYELCFSHDTKSLSLTIMQSQETSLLPENLQALVVTKQTYDIYPEGDFILDIFQCRGTAKISYGSTKTQLEESKPKVLDMIGMPDQPHAVRLQEGYSNLLLGVQGELSLIRWLHIDENLQKGLGYYIYRAGNLKYNSAFGQIQFLVDPVKLIKKTKTKLQKIRYNLYVSNSQEDLKYASLCEKYLPGSVIDYRLIHTSLSETPFKFLIQKKKLLQKYKEAENLFFNIVADLTLKTPDESLQEYRFIYKSQQLPAEVFVPSQLQKYDFSTLIAVLVLFIVAIIIFSWIFVKVIVPMIGRLKNRLLVEQNGLETSKEKKEDENNDEKDEPPPSSDRQGINLNDQVETQQKM